MSQEVRSAPRRFRRAFIALGVISIIAAVAVVGVAFLGASAPGILGIEAAFLIGGGLLATLAIIVPITLFALGRAASQADQAMAEAEASTQASIAKAHAQTKKQLEQQASSNARMHEHDRATADNLSQRLDEEAKRIEAAPAAGAALASKQTHKTIEEMENRMSQDMASFQQDLSHEIAAKADAQKGQLDHLDQAVARNDDEHQQLRQEIAALQSAMREQARDFDEKLASKEAPEHQMHAWAERANAHAEAEIKRMNHKLRTRIAAFEERESAALDQTIAQSRTDAALLAQALMQNGMESMDAEQKEKMGELKSWLDEQFAAFLAGQQARQIDSEERLAAIGATRGVRVDEHQHFTVTNHAPFGRVHPAHDIEGIGNKTSYALGKMGILDTEHLWHADTVALAEKLGIVPRQVRQWQAQAELMAVSGIGRQSAELLALSGVTSIQHLASLRPRELLDLLEKDGRARDKGIQSGRVGPSRAEELIRLATEHNPSQTVYV